MDQLFQQVRDALVEQAHIALTLEERSLWGGVFPCLRPLELVDLPSFSIVLIQSRLQAEAHFVPDTFAGSLVRRMGENIHFNPEAFSSVLAEANEQLGVTIRVDDRVVDVESLPNPPWRSFEIGCSKPIDRFALNDSRMEAFLDVAGTCLTLVVSALIQELSADIDEDAIEEGRQAEVIASRYERSPINRLRCLQAWGRRCWVCDFDFAERYGSLGTGFIEVHHITPLGAVGTSRIVDPKRDLVPLCSNCHSMVHRARVLDPIHPVQLREIVDLGPKDWPI